MEQNPIQEQLGPRRVLDYGSLDAWRGAACLAVVFFHCYLEMGLRIGRENRPVAFEWAQYGKLGVQVFFVISGFCIAVAAHSSWHKRSWGKFAWARVTRIYPPLWAALLLVMISKIVGMRLGAHVQDEATNRDFLYYVANFSLLNPAFGQPYLLSVAWSLCCEVTFYAIVFGALVAFSWAKSANWMLNALHALSLGMLVWFLAAFQGVPAPLFPINLWPQFGVGILVFDLLLARAQNEEKREKFLWAVGLAFATLGSAFLIRCWLSPLQGRFHSSFLPFAVSFGFAVILWLAYRFEESVSRWNFVKLLRSIGTFSYSIYLVHFTLIMALSRGVFGRLKFLPWPVEVALQVLFAVGSGWIFYQLVEKPSQKLKRVKK